MNTFSFRAEFVNDVFTFLREIHHIPGAITEQYRYVIHGDQLGEGEVELKVNATLEQLMDTLRGIEDSHVMLQTIKQCPLAENNCERNYDIV